MQICWKTQVVKVKQSLYIGFQEVEAPRFQDSQHMKVVRLSALCTCRLYPTRNFLISVTAEWVDRWAIVQPEILCQKKFHIHRRESNLRPSGLYSSAWTICGTMCHRWKIKVALYYSSQISWCRIWYYTCAEFTHNVYIDLFKEWRNFRKFLNLPSSVSQSNQLYWVTVCTGTQLGTSY